MKKFLTFCTSLVLLLGISVGANATIVANFKTDASINPFPGVLAVPDTKFFNFKPPAGPVDNQMLFEIAAPAFLIAGTLVTAAGFLKNKDGMGGPAVITLFAEDLSCVTCPTAPPTVDGSFVSPPTLFSSDGLTDTYSIGVLLTAITPARFFIDIQAIANSSGGGYQLTLNTIIPVPLPPAAVLFLSALAGFAGFSRIRRRKAETT